MLHKFCLIRSGKRPAASILGLPATLAGRQRHWMPAASKIFAVSPRAITDLQKPEERAESTFCFLREPNQFAQPQIFSGPLFHPQRDSWSISQNLRGEKADSRAGCLEEALFPRLGSAPVNNAAQIQSVGANHGLLFVLRKG
jgi:hypothetical protein